jgi:hypothetical protein
MLHSDWHICNHHQLLNGNWTTTLVLKLRQRLQQFLLQNVVGYVALCVARNIVGGLIDGLAQ